MPTNPTPLEAAREWIKEWRHPTNLQPYDEALASLITEREKLAVTPLQAEIDKAWFQIEHAYDLEPREYFERKAKTNGFESALAMAVFYLWKRDPKVQAAVAEATPGIERAARIKALEWVQEHWASLGFRKIEAEIAKLEAK